MASFFTSTCWPGRFIERWLAVFFGAVVLGTFLGWRFHRQAVPKPALPAKQTPKPQRVQVNLEAIEVYSDGSQGLVPAHVTTGGTGDKAIPESDQGKLSTDPKHLTQISRFPGSRLWLIYQWQGNSEPRLYDNWPLSTMTYRVEFHLNRPNPHPIKHRAAP